MYYSNKPLPIQTKQLSSSSLKVKYQQLSDYVYQLQECYTQKISILESSCSQSDKKVVDLETYIEQLQQQMNHKSQEVRQHQTQIQKLLGIIQQLQNIVQQKNTQNQQLAKQNSILKQQNQQIQVKLYASEFQAQSLKEQIKQKGQETNNTSLSLELSECKILKDISNQQKPLVKKIV